MVMGVPQEERAQIDAVERRLAQKYAELRPDHVAGVVQHVYARFNQSKLRDFVPLLVAIDFVRWELSMLGSVDMSPATNALD
jgi:hypothetical protein